MVEGRAIRIIFFGTPAFAVPTLDALLQSRHPVVGVVTQPDRPHGRGQKTTDAPVKARAVAASPIFFADGTRRAVHCRHVLGNHGGARRRNGDERAPRTVAP